MNLDKKLARWEDAGLIDTATRERIARFEASDRKPIVAYALGVLGAGTVALGIVSIIAANWDAIPANAKLAVDLAIGVGLAIATYLSLERRHAWLTEVLVTLFYGYTLASLGLVGQIYQLDTPLYQALLLWSGATLPLVLLGRSRYLGGLVTVGLATTHLATLDGLFDAVHWDRDTERNVFATLIFLSPLLYVPLSRTPWLVRERPEYARVLGALAWTAVLLGGFWIQFLWYDDVSSRRLTWALASTAVGAAALATTLPTLYPDLRAGARRALVAILAAGWLSLALATAFERGDIQLVGALMQLGWLGLCAWLALELGHVRGFNAATALVGLRVVVIYFEVFGSMLSTGLGLVTGGALTLLVAWLWRNKARDLAARFAAPAAGGDDAA